MEREKIKFKAKEYVINQFGKVFTPILASLLWGLIIAVIITILVVVPFLFSRIIGFIFLIPVILFSIFIIYNLKLKKAQFYLNLLRGNEKANLKSFFSFNGVFKNCWTLFVVDVLTLAVSFLTIFLPGYMSTLFMVKNYEIVDNDNKKAKQHFEFIPKLTQSHIFELAVLKMSFFWWNLLVIVTLGLAGLFVSPYKSLTEAYYYDELLKDYNKVDNNNLNYKNITTENNEIGRDVENNDNSEYEYIDIETNILDEDKFNEYITEFGNLEIEVAQYIQFENNCSDILDFEYLEDMQEFVSNNMFNIQYSISEELNRKNYKSIKEIINRYEQTKEIFDSIRQENYRQICEYLINIIDDRIKVLQLESMKVKKYTFSTLFGSRIIKLKNYINQTKDIAYTESFSDDCTAQIKVERKSTLVMAIIALAVFLICLVMPLGLGLGLAPLNTITIDGVEYSKGYIYNDYNGVTQFRYSSSGDCYNAYIKDNYLFTIKDEVRGLPVKAVSGVTYGGYRRITNVNIPNSVEVIGNYTFSNCENLKSISLPRSLKSIGEYAFNGCSSLTRITIPNNTKSIGNGAFDGCSSLTSITIPNSVKSIGGYAFRYCSSLNIINYNGTKSQWLSIYKQNYWNYNTQNFTIQCTDGKLNKYGNVIQ